MGGNSSRAGQTHRARNRPTTGATTSAHPCGGRSPTRRTHTKKMHARRRRGDANESIDDKPGRATTFLNPDPHAHAPPHAYAPPPVPEGGTRRTRLCTNDRRRDLDEAHGAGARHRRDKADVRSGKGKVPGPLTTPGHARATARCPRRTLPARDGARRGEQDQESRHPSRSRLDDRG